MTLLHFKVLGEKQLCSPRNFKKPILPHALRVLLSVGQNRKSVHHFAALCLKAWAWGSQLMKKKWGISGEPDVFMVINLNFFHNFVTISEQTNFQNCVTGSVYSVRAYSCILGDQQCSRWLATNI